MFVQQSVVIVDLSVMAHGQMNQARYVTRFAKAILIRSFCILRNTILSIETTVVYVVATSDLLYEVEQSYN